MSRTLYLVIINFVLRIHSLSSSETGSVQDAPVSTKSHIVYDVTERVNNILRYQSEYFSNVKYNNVDSSFYLYYRIETGENRSISANDVNYWLASPKYQMIAVSFLVRPSTPFFQTLNWSLTQQHLNYFVLHELYPPETVIYRVTGNITAETCYNYCPTDESIITIGDYLSNVKFENFQIGLEYNERFISCCGKRYPFILQRLKIAILNIEFDSTVSLLSYSLFAKQLNRLSERNQAFIKEINVNCLPYIHIRVPTVSEEFSNTEFNLYRAYISEYTKSWSINSSNNNTVIIDSFPDNIFVTPFGTQKYQKIRPVLQLSSTYLYRSLEWHDVAFSPCQIRNIIETVGEVATDLHLDYTHFAIFSSLAFECKNTNVNLNKRRVYPNLHITNSFKSAQEAVGIVTKIEQHSGGIYELKTIYFQNTPPPLTDSPQTEYFWRFMSERNISVGCNSNILVIADLKTFMADILDRCNLVFRKSPLLLLNWLLGIESNDVRLLNVAFEEALTARKEFLKIYSNGEIILQPNVRDLDVSSDDLVINPKMRVDIYCAEHLEAVHSFNEIIATWGEINNFTVNLGRVIDAGERGMWHKVQTDNELNRTATDFAVLVRRNIPQTISGSIEFPNTYPCIHFTVFPNVDIQFETNQFAGITFDTSLKMDLSSNPKKLQTLLLYCFGKFSNVEMRTFPRVKIFDTLPAVFTVEFADALLPQLEIVENLQLYLEIEGIDSLNKLLNTLPSFASVMHIGIHLIDWEHYNFEENTKIKTALESFYNRQNMNISFGLSSRNCLEEMNTNLGNFKAVKYLTHIKYILCDVKPVFPTNINQEEMQIYLDTNFYVKQYFKDKLGLDVIFRLNFHSNNCPVDSSTDIENYLRFLNDTSQHAMSYGVKYFMGKAFNADDDKCELSWWRISDLSDLTNDTVYTELESAYFGRETRRKLQIIPTVTKLLTDYKLIIGLSVLSLILIGTVVGVFIHYRRMRNRFLTKTELNDFRNGCQRSAFTEDQLELYDIRKHEAESQPFLIDFEIAKDSIQLGKIIGRGNFGLVHKATFKKTEIVAVKTPPQACSKEIFKTMLAEVKVLCYIGLHPNVLRFIGAYTKEIEKGFIYIVTEFCENNSLEKYLRRRKVTTAVNNDSSNKTESSTSGYVANAKLNQTIQINELHRFSYEIANGMSYLSRRKVVHGDLSIRNVLLTGENVCKIGDFGLSRKLYKKEKYVKQSDEELPWKWMAIESLKRMEFTTKSDVWSFGVTLWEIFTLGDIPYHGMDGWTGDFNLRLENGLRLSKPPLATEETLFIEDDTLKCYNVGISYLIDDLIFSHFQATFMRNSSRILEKGIVN